MKIDASGNRILPSIFNCNYPPVIKTTKAVSLYYLVNVENISPTPSPKRIAPTNASAFGKRKNPKPTPATTPPPMAQPLRSVFLDFMVLISFGFIALLFVEKCFPNGITPQTRNSLPTVVSVVTKATHLT